MKVITLVPVRSLIIRIDYLLYNADSILPTVVIDIDLIARILNYLIDPEDTGLSVDYNFNLWNNMVNDITSVLDDENRAYALVNDAIDLIIKYFARYGLDLDVKGDELPNITSWRIRRNREEDSVFEFIG